MSENRKFLSPELNELTGQLLNQFYSLLRLVQIHELNNEIFDEPLRHFKSLQKSLFQKEGKVEFRFFESEVFFNLVRIRLTSEVKAIVLDLVKEFKDQNLGGFALLDTADSEKTKAFLVILNEYLK